MSRSRRQTNATLIRVYQRIAQQSGLIIASPGILDAPDYETLAERWVEGQLTAGQVYDLAPLVFEVSEAGDSVARQLIRARHRVWHGGQCDPASAQSA